MPTLSSGPEAALAFSFVPSGVAGASRAPFRSTLSVGATSTQGIPRRPTVRLISRQPPTLF